jgi:hypothetical protein
MIRPSFYLTGLSKKLNTLLYTPLTTVSLQLLKPEKSQRGQNPPQSLQFYVCFPRNP